MLQEVRQDLSDVVSVCEGKKKQTNYLRTLISDLVKGRILLSHSALLKLHIVGLDQVGVIGQFVH